MEKKTMTSAEIQAKIEASQRAKAAKKEFKASLRQANADEWAEICQEYNHNVYVFHSSQGAYPLQTMAATNNRMRKKDVGTSDVTVVAVVKTEDDGTYTLQIGWSQCSPHDVYDRKLGNLIAIRRAIRPDSEIPTSLDYSVKPFVVKGFATRFLKDVAQFYADFIIDKFAFAYDKSTFAVIETPENFEFRNATLGVVTFDSADEPTDEPVDEWEDDIN